MCVVDLKALEAQLLAATGLVLETPEILRVGRAVTVRYRVAEGGEPGSVIVKRAEPASETFRREAAALRVLLGCSTDHARVPRLLHDLSTDGVLVIEDLSPAKPLDQLLGSDEEPRRSALLRVARALGELHGSARQAAPTFEHVPAGVPAYRQQAQVLRRAVPRARAFINAVVPAIGEPLETALDRLAASVAEDGPCSTVTVGDMAPSNVLLDDSRVIFVDFEYAGVRHPFYDAMFWRCIVPFRPGIADAMEAHYGAGLASRCFELDDDAFRRDMTRLASHRATQRTGGFPSRHRPWPHAFVSRSSHQHDLEDCSCDLDAVAVLERCLALEALVVQQQTVRRVHVDELDAVLGAFDEGVGARDCVARYPDEAL
jgi:thiamine kinase-like enzyme